MNVLPEKHSSNSHLIEVAHKRGVKDALATEISEEFKHLGVSATPKVSTSKLYRLLGDLTPEQRTRIGRDLLADPVVEEFQEAQESTAKKSKSAKAKEPRSVIVDVWFKPGVTDAVGESVLKGLRDMKVDTIRDVRTGLRYRFWGLANVKAVEKLALAALLNPLIHERFIHVD